MPVDLTEIEHLAELIKHSSLREITIKEGDSRLTLRRSLRNQGVTALSLREETEWDDDILYESQLVDEEEVTVPEVSKNTSITAPAVGVFRHIKPGIGLQARIRAGQVVGIIEVMNVPCEVLSEADGIVVDVQIEDGLPVEYGQGLFVLRPVQE